MHERQRQRQRHRQREKQAPSGEPDVGLNPGSPEPHPEPKADAQPLSHPGAPQLGFESICFCNFFKDFIYLFMRDTER